MAPVTRSVMAPADLSQLVWLPAVEPALRALSPPCGKTRDVPRMTPFHVGWRGGSPGEARRGKGGQLPLATTQPKSHRPFPLLESPGQVFTPEIVTEGTCNPIKGLNRVPTNIHMLNSKPSGIQNVNVFGDGIFREVIKLT